MAVDVVVVNYRTPHLLRDFCASYEQHAFPGCTLTIVDVDPRTEATSYLHDTFHEAVLPLGENHGYAYACNRGAHRGRNDVILLANSDTLLSDGLHECHAALMAHDDWGILGPRQVDASNRITAGGIFGTSEKPAPRGWLRPDTGQYADVRDDAVTIPGSLFFIKRSVWNLLTRCDLFQQVNPGALGAFLETKLYYEETFCAYHARAHGYRCVYYGPVQMVHLYHQSIGSDPDGWGENQFQLSQKLFYDACQVHDISYGRA